MSLVSKLVFTVCSGECTDLLYCAAQTSVAGSFMFQLYLLSGG